MITLGQLTIYLPYKPKFNWNGAIYVIDFDHKHDRCHKGAMSIQSANILIGKGTIIPIFRPLSDLTKPITIEGYNDGKEFTPIVELAKAAYPKMKSHVGVVGSYAYSESGYSFHYVVSEGSFDCRVGYNDDRWDCNCFVNNQFKLFQLMASWHIWWGDQSLFNSNEIIDVNSI